MPTNKTRARTIANHARTLLAVNRKLPPSEHLSVLVVVGKGRNRASELVMPTNWAADEVYEQIHIELENRHKWGHEVRDHANTLQQLCETLLEFISAVANKRNRPDPGLKQAAVVFYHPEGVVRLGFMKGRPGESMRDELITHVAEQQPAENHG